MSKPDQSTSPPAETWVEIDAFSYFPEVASKIRGLGGTEERPEISYGFHTQYIRCASGRCRFAIQFDDLQASSGVLQLQVNMLSDRPGSHAKIASVERLWLAECSSAGGGASVRFEALLGQTYALYGMIADRTDASARSLKVTIDRPASQPEAIKPTERSDVYQSGMIDTSERLSSDQAARFLTPVSQVFTGRQTKEPAFLRTMQQLGAVRNGNDAALWPELFVFRALDQYGLNARASRGLGLGMEAPLVERALTAAGAELTLERNANQNGDFHDFDFLWHIGPCDSFGNIQVATDMIEASLNWLRCGGLAIHVLRFVRDAALTTDAMPIAFRKIDLERLALNLVSRGHQVAQLKFELGHRPFAGSSRNARQSVFGLIARRVE